MSAMSRWTSASVFCMCSDMTHALLGVGSPSSSLRMAMQVATDLVSRCGGVGDMIILKKQSLTSCNIGTPPSVMDGSRSTLQRRAACYKSIDAPISSADDRSHDSPARAGWGGLDDRPV